MKKISLEYNFKGNRKYVHGTDIYKQIVKNLDILGYYNWQYFELSIKKNSQCNMFCYITDKKYKHKEEIINFVLRKGSDQVFGCIIEDVTNEISSKYLFDENNITNHCTINYELETITYANSQNIYSTIDIILSMTRFYLENAVDKSVKWFFRAITLLRPIEEIEIQKILMKKIMIKMNFVKFEIYIENEMIGHGIAASIS